MFEDTAIVALNTSSYLLMLFFAACS